MNVHGRKKKKFSLLMVGSWKNIKCVFGWQSNYSPFHLSLALLAVSDMRQRGGVAKRSLSDADLVVDGCHSGEWPPDVSVWF